MVAIPFPRRAAWLTFSLVTLLACALATYAQQEQRRVTAEADSADDARSIRVDVELVRVPVSVTDPTGRLVDGLEREDFRLFEDGVEQELVHITAEDGPISVALIFDVSGSMKKQFEAARDTAMKFLGAANKDDEFLLVQFERHARLVSTLTRRLDDLERKTLATDARGSTALLDAIYLGVSQLRYARNKRRALLLITDGEENHSRYNERDVQNLLKEADVQFYAIGKFGWLRGGLVRELADLTGGRVFTDYKMDNTAEHIWQELRNQYVLGYKSSNKARDGKWRKVKVRVRPPRGSPKLYVNAKSGYLAPE